MKNLLKILFLLIPVLSFAQNGTGFFGKIGVNVGTTTPTERAKIGGSMTVTGALKFQNYGTGVLKTNASGEVNSAAIVNSDISSSAAIDYTKISGLSVNNIAALKLKTGTYNGQLATLLGYYTYADGGEGNFYWNSTSTATDNGGTIIQVTGVSTGRWIRLFKNNQINIKCFGAKGDNTQNDLVYIQNAINYCALNEYTLFFPIGEYLVSNNLFIFGKCSLKGESNTGSNIVLSAIPTREYWICVGVPSYGGTVSTWNGQIDNLGFKINNQVQIGINLFQAKDSQISNCVFTSNGKTSNKIVGGINNGSYVSPSLFYPRDNITISNNILYANKDEGESIGFSARGRKIKVTYNQIIGASGDDLGFHNIDDSEISNNYIEAYNARIYVSNSRNINILSNTINYIDGTTAGMGILVEAESIVTPIVCDNINIENNTVIYNATHPEVQYGVRIKSGRNIKITKNRLINYSTVYPSGSIMIENQALTGFVDPTGVDPNGTINTRNVIVDANICDGQIGFNGGENGAIIVTNNVALNYYSIQSLSFLNNTYTTTDRSKNAITASKFYKNSSFPIFSGIGLTGSSYQILKIGNAGNRYVFRKKSRILSMDISLSSSLTSGFYQIEFYKNGVLCGSTKTYSVVGTNGNASISTSATDTNFDFIEGDVLYIQMKLNNGVPTTNDVSISLNSIDFN